MRHLNNKHARRISLFTCAVFMLVWLSAVPVAAARAERHAVVVQVDQPGAAISPTLFGVFFEDINFAADGGIYAELVKNRSFEFPEALMGWTKLEQGGAKGTLAVMARDSSGGNNHQHLRVSVEEAGGEFGVTNEGFRGIGVKGGAEYVFSVQARKADGGPFALRVELVNDSGQKLAQTTLSGFTGQWKKHTRTLRASATDPKARLNLIMEGSRGALDLDMVSLFPRDTWKRRPNGLRPDLVQLLKEMKPGFVRFPGGCIVEGRDLNNRYQWKTTIGDVADRRLIMNRWNVEFKNRNAPDYYQSFGLGFYEYFLLAEDLGAEPLPIINCGMACQYNTGELASLDAIEPYIQDALDLVEFANGPVSSPWGRKRAAMGHPAPFNLKMIGIGNEQWGPQYLERYPLFAKAFKARYPNIKLVSSAGPSPNGERFDLLWKGLRELKADIVDEHYYQKPSWFTENVGRYDDYDRNGPKVFAGEFAAHVSVRGRADRPNNWEAALAEAAFMTGLERNADIVLMASYAPLFAHVEAWQWTPNLIWFDNLRSFATPSYHVQQLFSANRGTTILPVTLDGSSKNGQASLYASATRDDRTGEVILKLVNTSAERRDLRINLAGMKKAKETGTALVLTSADLKAENSLKEPAKVSPAASKLVVPSTEFDYQLAPNSLVVLRLGQKY